MRILYRCTHLEAFWIAAGLALASVGSAPAAVTTAAQDPEEPPEVVEPPELSAAEIRSPEPLCQRVSILMCEDFEDSDRSTWGDFGGEGFGVEDDEAFGGKRSLRQRYAQGKAIGGWLSWFFGDHPQARVRPDATFREVHFRFYHQFEERWPRRFPPRFARLASDFRDAENRSAWQERLYISARLPDGTPVSVPISGLAAPDGTRYLGGDGLRWLERVPLEWRFAERTGEWVAIEMSVKLNTPGASDARITYRMNDQVVLDREGLNLSGAYTGTTINVAMLETYWNSGAPVDDLKRWYDNVVVATEPIGCAVWTVEKKELDDQSGWQLQVATAPNEAALVWDSAEIDGPGVMVDVSEANGHFADGADRCLLPSRPYVMRARQAVAGTWSAWSDWMPFF